MRMVAVDLVVGALAKRRQKTINVSEIVRWLRIVVNLALQTHGINLEKEANHFPKLKGITLQRRIVAKLALSLSGSIQLEEVRLQRVDRFQNVLSPLNELVLDAIWYVPPQRLCMILLCSRLPLHGVPYDQMLRVSRYPRWVLKEETD